MAVKPRSYRLLISTKVEMFRVCPLSFCLEQFLHYGLAIDLQQFSLISSLLCYVDIPQPRDF